MFAAINQRQCVLFFEVFSIILRISHCMYYSTKIEVMVEPIQRENLASFEVNASPVIKVIHRILLNF